MSVTGEPGRPPVKVGVPLTDLGAALFALSAILAALHYRHRTGRGQHIDTSLVEAGIALSVWEVGRVLRPRASPPEPLGSAHRMLAPYQAIRCADGYITLGGGTDRLFERSVRAPRPPGVDRRPGLRERHASRPQSCRRSSSASRRSPRGEPRAHWLARLDAAGVPCGPINDYAETFADPQVRARGMVVDVEHPTLGRCARWARRSRCRRRRPSIGRRAPLLGEHTREVLREVGYDEEEIKEVMADAGLAV